MISKKLKNKKLSERDYAIRAYRNRGESLLALSAQYGISEERIRQILRNSGGNERMINKKEGEKLLQKVLNHESPRIEFLQETQKNKKFRVSIYRVSDIIVRMEFKDLTPNLRLEDK